MVWYGMGLYGMVCLPNWLSMSATSSLFTTPSLSLSKIWNPSLSTLTCAGCSWERAFPCNGGGDLADDMWAGEARDRYGAISAVWLNPRGV